MRKHNKENQTMETRTENLNPITEGRYTLNPHSMKRIAAILDSAAHCTSKDEARPALNSVFLEITAEEWTATATDSYLLATMHTATNPVATDAPNSLHAVGSFMIPRTVCTQWIKTLNARSTTYAQIEVDVETLTLRTNETSHTTARYLGNGSHTEFPNFRNLIPELHTYTEEEKAAPVGYHPARLAQIAQSAHKLAPKGLDLALTVEASHPTKPTRLACTVQDVARWVGLIMPMRTR
jgi:DNA polymerase III sliding clamp (beta) subunit (PCNA family)